MRCLFILTSLIIAYSINAQNNSITDIKNKITIQEFPEFSAEYEQMQKGLKLLETQGVELAMKLKQHDSTLKVVKGQVEQLEKKANASMEATVVKGQSQLLDATKSMQETQMSFNIQYLQLQNQMQHENRSYTAISNIMKTKHDTVKNSISNIR